MATSGRKKKPTELHILNGNPSKLNINKILESEPKMDKYSATNIPEPPEWLDEIAKEEWRRVVPILVKTNLLAFGDTSALEAYCKTYSRWRKAEAEMDKVNSTVFKTPNNYVQQLPQVAIAQKYLNICKAFMAEFGLTPSSRSRMLLPGETEENDFNRKFGNV
jgi:P27 family predicted phage terminase small subunit